MKQQVAYSVGIVIPIIKVGNHNDIKIIHNYLNNKVFKLLEDNNQIVSNYYLENNKIVHIGSPNSITDVFASYFNVRITCIIEIETKKELVIFQLTEYIEKNILLKFNDSIPDLKTYNLQIINSKIFENNKPNNNNINIVNDKVSEFLKLHNISFNNDLFKEVINCITIKYSKKYPILEDLKLTSFEHLCNYLFNNVLNSKDIEVMSNLLKYS